MIGWKRKSKQMSPPQILAVGFLVTIVIGACLLMLPIATVEPISWMDALFTSTSATTVTGLSVVDIGTRFTMFGQMIMMLLISIGGLGFMTFALLVLLTLGKKIGFKERLIIGESFNLTSTGGIVRLVKMLLVFTFSMELLATLLLAVRWVPEYGWKDGLFTSLFHAISAFNNAGFSLWSTNLMEYVGDPIVNSVITILIIVGGIGFTVVYDAIHAKRFQNLRLHSKIMIVGTLVINVVAMFVIFTLEYSNSSTIGDLPLDEKLWASYFQAVSPRTAGFNTIDVASMNPSSLTATLGLMFIGAGNGSTASGIKVTTFVIILFAVVGYLRGRKETVIFKRTIQDQQVIRAMSIAVIGFMALFVSIIILSITEKAPFMWIVYETFSAFGTVGLSMGLTAELSTVGKSVLMILMIIGRIGPLTILFAMTRTTKSNVHYPKGDVFT